MHECSTITLISAILGKEGGKEGRKEGQSAILAGSHSHNYRGLDLHVATGKQKGY